MEGIQQHLHGEKEPSNGVADLHQEALKLSPLKPEIPAKHSNITPIDMQGVYKYKALLRNYGHWCVDLPASLALHYLCCP